MAFDKNSASDLLALKTEVETDPASVGYSAANGDTGVIRELLNSPDSNPVPTNGPAALLAEDLLKIVFDENVSAGDQFRVQLLFEMTTSPQEDLSRFKGHLSALDTGLATAIAAHVRPLSRAEVLFGIVDENLVYESVSISRDDWITARES